MTNITNLSAINSGDAVVADIVSHNFSRIEVAINSNALNSENYGQSSILSQHIATEAIVSQHISDSSVNSAKLSDSAVVHDKVDFSSANGGVRVVQIGAASNSMPAGGVMVAALTKSFTVDRNTISFSQNFAFSDAIHGNPNFSASPQVGYPAFVTPASTDSAPTEAHVYSLDSATADMLFRYAATAVQTDTLTVHLLVRGPLS